MAEREAQTDPLIVRGEDAREGKQLAETQQRNLHRYLRRVAGQGVPDPGRDLLYLEPAGASAGLEDAELGELIESDAPEDPDRVVDGVRDRSVREQQASAQVLGEMADDEFGDERANVVSALLGVAEVLGEEVGPIADRLAASLAGFREEQSLPAEHLVGALGIALSASGRHQSLVEGVLGDDRLFADPARVARVLAMLDRIPTGMRVRVFEFSKEQVAGAPHLLLEPLGSLPGETARELLTAPTISDAIIASLRAWESEGRTEDVKAFAQQLYDAVALRETAEPSLGQATQRLLLPIDSAYSVVRDRAEQVMTAAPDKAAADDDALIGLRKGPAEDWPFWSGQLSSNPSGSAEQGKAAVESLIVVVNAFRSEEASKRDEAVKSAQLVGPYLGGAVDDDRTKLRNTFNSVLQADTWWSSDEATTTQLRLHDLWRGLGAADRKVTGDLPNMLVEDLRRPLGTPFDWHQPQTLKGLREMGSRLRAPLAKELLDALIAGGTTGNADLDLQIMHTRAVLAQTAGSDAVGGAEVVDQNILVEAGQRQAPETSVAAEAWLRLDPPANAVKDVALAIGGDPTPELRSAVGEWAERRDDAARTELVKELLTSEVDVSTWVGAIAQHAVDERAVAEEILRLTREASRVERRHGLVASLVALSPQTYQGQKAVADLIIHLLNTGKKVDFDVALEAIPALGQGHRSTERLRKGFRDAAEKYGHKVPKRSLEALARADIKLPKKSLTNSARDALKSFFR